MKRATFLLLFFAMPLLAFPPGDPPSGRSSDLLQQYARPDRSRADDMLRGTGIRFRENRGQVAGTDGKARFDIAFTADAPGARLYFRNDGISYVFSKMADPADVSSRTKRGISNEPLSDLTVPDEQQNSGTEIFRLDMTLEGCNPYVRIRAEEPLPGYANFYLPHCPEGVIGVREFGRIVYENVYKNVDLELFSANGRVKYNFLVRPGGDPGNIRMRYDGALDASVAEDGALSVMTPLGGIEEGAPYTYTAVGRDEVASHYLRKGNAVMFSIGEYDRSETLVIDPWATYYGGSADEYANGIAADPAGNVYVVGWTTSTDFPVTPGAFQSTGSGANDHDAFAMKFSSLGQILWATYYGGSSTDIAGSVAIDGAGRIDVFGSTGSANFPMSTGAYRKIFGGVYDAFLVQLNGDGQRNWATYYGGSGNDVYDAHIKLSLTTDGADNIIFTGATLSKNFPVSAGAYQATKAKGTTADAYLAKFSSAGARLWATYYGGKGTDVGFAVCVDGQNDIVFAGRTDGTDFPVTAGAFQTSLKGSQDGFIVKFSANGSRLWATYYGGSSFDQFEQARTDENGNIYLGGGSASNNFPATAGVYQSELRGNWDAVIVKFTSSGRRVYATYCGGVGEDIAHGMAVESGGQVIVTGSTWSLDFPVLNALQPAKAGGNNGYADAFVAKLNNSASALVWSTYYGGTLGDWTHCATRDIFGNILLGGHTNSTDFPTCNPAQTTNAGGMDAFVVVLTPAGQMQKRVENPPQIPAAVTLDQNYPNPFVQSTVIPFSIPAEGNVRISVFDLLGREIAILHDGLLPAGKNSVQWVPRESLAPGFYIVRLTLEDAVRGLVTLQRKMITMR